MTLAAVGVTAAAMLGEHGRPRTKLFVADGLDLSRQGYALWDELVRAALDAAMAPGSTTHTGSAAAARERPGSSDRGVSVDCGD